MARKIEVVYIREDNLNKYAHSDSEALNVITGAMRVIGFTDIKIYTSTRNVIEVLSKLYKNNPHCKEVVVTIHKETDFQYRVRNKLSRLKNG